MRFLAIVGLFIALTFLDATPVEAQNCPAGSRRAQLGDAIVKNTKARIKVGDCYNPLDPGVSQTEEEAKRYLKSLPKQFAGGSSRDCKTYEDKNIDQLNGAFAICAANFLRAYLAQPGTRVTITSAYRSYEEQKCVCIGEMGPCGEALPVDSTGRPIGGRGVGHQYGTAMDVRAGDRSDAEYARMHEFARTNPQFGIYYPWPLSNRAVGKMVDRPHFEPLNAACGSGGNSPIPSYSGPNVGGLPTAQFSNAIRQALGVPAQPQVMYPPIQAPLPTTQSPIPDFEVQTASSTNTDTNINTNTGTSAAEILRDLAFGKPATTSNATSVPITVGTSSGMITSAGTSVATETPQWHMPTIVQNTFTSQDLGWHRASPQTSLQRMLAELRAIFTETLKYLKPFQGNVPSSGESFNAN